MDSDEAGEVMQGLPLDPIDRVCCTELHLEWADGREYWSEDPAEVARAVMYRRRVRTFLEPRLGPALFNS